MRRLHTINLGRIHARRLPRGAATPDGIANNDVELIASTPAELGERIRGDFQVWEKTIRETGIKLE